MELAAIAALQHDCIFFNQFQVHNGSLTWSGKELTSNFANSRNLLYTYILRKQRSHTVETKIQSCMSKD